MAEFDSSSGLLATKLEESPSTVWVWDLAAAELRSVLIFHANVTGIRWHPHIRELLLLSCEGDGYGGLAFVWDPLSNGPRSVDFSRRLPGRKVAGRSRLTWLGSKSDSAAVFLSDSKAYLLASLTESDSPPFPCQSEESTELAAGASTDDFTLDTPIISVGEDIDEDFSVASDEGLSEMDDTFSFRR